MKVTPALLYALTFLIVGSHAIPGAADFFNNFEAVVRRSMTVPPSRFKHRRASGLLVFPSDEASVLKRQSSCTSSCSSSNDTSILQNSLGNATCALDTGCVCNALSQLSSACETCVLASQGYSISSYQSACQAATSVIAVGSAVATAEEAVQSGTGSCVSQCGNSTEIDGLDAIVGCGNNALCICSATNVTSDSALTEGCLSCLLQQSGTTVSGLQSMCNAALASGSASASGASATSSLSGSTTASHASTTGSATRPTGSASSTSPSASASAKSRALKLSSTNKLESICLAILAGSFFWLA